MKQDQANRIESYLLGKMPKEELELFEKDLVKDKDLQMETERMRKILRGIELGFNRELKSKLQKEEGSISSRSRAVKTLIYISGIAAGIALLGLIYYFAPWQSSDPTRIAASFYEPYPNIVQPLSRSEEAVNPAFSFYESGQYAEALDGFEKILSSDPFNDAALFYGGIASLEMKRPEKAVVYLGKLIEKQENTFIRPAIWYASIAYLYLGDKENARVYLEMLQGEIDKYARNSEKILRRL